MVARVLIGMLLVAGSISADPTQVSRDALVAAMAAETGYDPTVTTNGGRFQAGTILRLVRDAVTADPTGGPLLISHEDWFRAFLTSQNLVEEDAPQFVRLSYEHEQQTEVEYRRDRVIERVGGGPEPVTAANVVIWWDPRADGKRKYSYDDTLPTPNLRVTNHRVITYRLVDFGDQVVFDKLTGLTGRPTTGVLGLLFKMIGEGRVIWSRMSISVDGLQVARARSKKGFLGVTSTVTVEPDGRTSKDVPADRPDLKRIEERLKTDFDLDYVPLKHGR